MSETGKVQINFLFGSKPIMPQQVVRFEMTRIPWWIRGYYHAKEIAIRAVLILGMAISFWATVFGILALQKAFQ